MLASGFMSPSINIFNIFIVLRLSTGDWISLAHMLWGRKGAPCQRVCATGDTLKPLCKGITQLFPRRGLGRAWLPEAWAGVWGGCFWAGTRERGNPGACDKNGTYAGEGNSVLGTKQSPLSIARDQTDATRQALQTSSRVPES